MDFDESGNIVMGRFPGGKRKPRAGLGENVPVSFDEYGNPVPVDPQPGVTMATPPAGAQPSSTPGVQEVTQPAGMAGPDWAMSSRTNSDGTITYYGPTRGALIGGSVQAAVDTGADLASQAQAAVKNVGQYAPLMIAAAVLFFAWRLMED